VIGAIALIVLVLALAAVAIWAGRGGETKGKAGDSTNSWSAGG
jgi:hypothetical protein